MPRLLRPLLLLLLVLGAAAPAAAQQCIGTVEGLSRTYDPRTGSGFLAVRAGPTVSALQIGELFNGDRVDILDRQGNWYRIYAPGIGSGWASVRWIRSSCRAPVRQCIGTVEGLSRVYDPRTGSGFLAVRAGPTVSARQIGELFNGDRVEILDRQGTWYRISAPGIGNGWASVRWIRNSCRY